MPVDRSAFRWTPVAGALALALCAAALPARAALFEDDEARRAILDLRTKVDANRQAAEQANERLAQELKSLADSGVGTTRRAMLDLVNQLEDMRRELATLRGQNEKLAYDLSELQRQLSDQQRAVDDRLRPFEPVKVTVDGQEFLVKPEEKQAFESAMATLRASNFAQAAQAYGDFLDRYPATGYAPLALYWQGNALYAARSYKPAIQSYQRLMAQFPDHPRVPEAMLAIANCHIELKDARSAKAMLQQLAKSHPETESGATARDRLARLR